ncbi:hypothetical protein Tco_0295299 [Tanacetum coccineum]
MSTKAIWLYWYIGNSYVGNGKDKMDLSLKATTKLNWNDAIDSQSIRLTKFWQSLQNALGTQLDMSTAYRPETMTK